MTSSSLALWGLRILTAVMLVVDAVVHLQQASNYQLAAPGGIGEGNIFRIEAVVAIGIAGYVLLIGSRLSFILAFLVAASAFAAVVIYRYVDIGGFGPIPAMYEPVWFSFKAYSALARLSVRSARLLASSSWGVAPAPDRRDNAALHAPMLKVWTLLPKFFSC